MHTESTHALSGKMQAIQTLTFLEQSMLKPVDNLAQCCCGVLELLLSLRACS